jgi:hypothetical protein
MTWETHYEALRLIAKAFYQAYRLTGTVKLKFGIRAIEDSDGNSVVDVYVSPLDAEAASALANTDHSHHLQLLETMVPSAVLGYQFLMQITSKGPNDIQACVLESTQPFLTVSSK